MCLARWNTTVAVAGCSHVCRQGSWWKQRRVVAYALMIVFVAIPHLRIGGKPLILLDIAARQFTIFGRTFLPNDTLVLALVHVDGVCVDRAGHGDRRTCLVRMGVSANGLHGILVSTHRSLVRRHDREGWQASPRHVWHSGMSAGFLSILP